MAAGASSKKQRGAAGEAEAGCDAAALARHLVHALRAAVEAGDEHWFYPLAQAIRSWPLPEEHVNGRTYHYLVGGEAFDWLLLAERMTEELAGLAPPEEVEQLIFHGRLPEAVEGDLQQILGAKYRAHLNFVYGVGVETALQLAVLGEVQKEQHSSRVWENGHGDDEAFHRIYGDTRIDMLARFQQDRAHTSANPEAEGPTDQISLHDLSEFTYWLFRTRVQNSDPARVASDTRKGLAHYQRLEALRKATGRAEQA